MGVMGKVRYSEWAAPIVPVVKGGEVTINTALDVSTAQP